MRFRSFYFSVLIYLAIGMLTGCVSSNPEISKAVFESSSPAIDFNDKRWDGIAIPETEVGKRCGATDPYFPSLSIDLDKLSQIFESKVTGLNVEVLDRDNPTYHGSWSYTLPESGVFKTPPVPSETMNLPEGVKGLRRHSWNSVSAGYYLAPSSCVVGGGHVYYSYLKFRLADDRKIKLKFVLGKQK